MNRLTNNGKTSSLDYTKEIYAKLAEYEDLEEQGKLIKLPCKLGTPIYIVYHTDVVEREFTYLYIGYKLGVDYFLTKEEAENNLPSIKVNERNRNKSNSKK